MGRSGKEEMEARRSALLLLLVSLGVLIQGAPLGDDVLERLDNELNALVETDETSTDARSAMDDVLNNVKSEEEQSQADKNDKDPYKQRKTYTKEMKKYEQDVKWHKEHPKKKGGIIKKYDPLNDFKSKADMQKRARKIAKDIYKIIKKPVAKKAEETALQRSVRLIKERGIRDANMIKRIRKAIIRRDKREKTRQRKSDRRLAKEKKKPKLAIKNSIRRTMAKEDKKLEKDPKMPSAAAVAAVEASAEKPEDKLKGFQPTKPIGNDPGDDN